MLPRRNRLTTAEFDRAFNKSQVVRHPLVQVRAHRRAETTGTDEAQTEVRAAFVVPKKQGKAHDRNRTKRRLRERFRLHPRRTEANLRDCDLIFLTTPTTHAASNAELDAALDEVLRRLAKRMSEGGNAQKREPVAVSAGKDSLPQPPKSSLQGGVSPAGHGQNASFSTAPCPVGHLAKPGAGGFIPPESGSQPLLPQPPMSSEVGEVPKKAENFLDNEAASASACDPQELIAGSGPPPFQGGVRGGSTPPVEETPPSKPPFRFQNAPISWLFIVAIRFYQRAISPALPPSCRFFPTCSAYTVSAIERHGAFWGTLLGAWRICRCTPLCKGGFDPVPDHLDPRFCSPFLGLLTKDKSPKAG